MKSHAMSVPPDWSAFAGQDPTQPGIVVAMVSAGRVDAWRSFGAAKPRGEPLGSTSVFYVASVAKQVTAACVGLLILDGRLSVQDDVHRHIPELPTYGVTMRIEHLLSHTSGLPAGDDLDRAAGWDVARPFTTAERVQLIATASLEHEPGTFHRYSNHGYVLLAEIVERVTGTCLGEFAAERLFRPLGMTATGFLDTVQPAPVPGWTASGERVEVLFRCVGDGGLVTDIEDLARWDGWLPSSSLGDLMLTSRPLLPDGRWAHDAWGISMRTHKGQRIQSHGGSIAGYMASFVRFPDLGISFIALANTDAGGVGFFGRRLRSFVDVALANALVPDLPDWTLTHGIPIEGG